MMTRRERLEAKVEKRGEWAAKARSRSAERAEAAHKIVEHIPLGQPVLVGHHSERKARRDIARMTSNMDKSVEEHKLAEHHASKARGLSAQLDRTIYDDDPDAVERLEARIAATLAANEKAKAINKAWRRGMANAGAQAPRAEQLAAAAGHVVGNGLLTEAVAAEMVRTMLLCGWMKSPCSTTGASASVRTDRERIESIKVRRERASQAKAAPAGILVETLSAPGWDSGGEYVRVTFPEKPETATLDALRGAGFVWRAGSWVGKTQALAALLPAELRGDGEILVSVAWPCETSPIGLCAYNLDRDRCCDECLICGEPLERK